MEQTVVKAAVSEQARKLTGSSVCGETVAILTLTQAPGHVSQQLPPKCCHNDITSQTPHYAVATQQPVGYSINNEGRQSEPSHVPGGHLLETLSLVS